MRRKRGFCCASDGWRFVRQILCSTRAAGQLGDVLAERQRSELQALDGGEIRKDRIREIVNGETLPDRQRRGLDAVGSFRREDMRAEQPAAAGVGHELDESTSVASGERARHLVETNR